VILRALPSCILQTFLVLGKSIKAFDLQGVGSVGMRFFGAGEERTALCKRNFLADNLNQR